VRIGPAVHGNFKEFVVARVPAGANGRPNLNNAGYGLDLFKEWLDGPGRNIAREFGASQNNLQFRPGGCRN